MAAIPNALILKRAEPDGTAAGPPIPAPEATQAPRLLITGTRPAQ